MPTPANIQDIMDKIEADRKAAAKLAISKRAQLGQRLLAAGVLKVTVGFYGSGDSGSIEEITFEYEPGKELPKEAEKVLHVDIEKWTYRWLEGTGVDWYNNEGGQGEVVFDLTEVPFKFTGHVDVNEIVSERAVSKEEIL